MDMSETEKLNEIISGCKQGNNEAFSKLIDLYSDRCYGYFYRLTGDVNISNDLLSDLFLRLVQRINSFTGSSFNNWIFTVASNIFRDYLRQKYRRQKLIDAAGAKTVFYQTWGRRDGDKKNAERFPDYQSMQKALSESYASVAKKCDAILAPVGDTWATVRNANSKLGAALYKGDGSHPSAKGAYLAACVFYSAIFEQSPEKIEFEGDVTEAEAAVILEALR